MNLTIPFAKGHATENDFIIIPDEQAQIDLTPEQVVQLCDRRAGIGADGILRVVKAAAIEDSTVDPDLWFMDYRNADGSLAEMCGNGVRLFAHWLYSRGLVDAKSFDIGTRAGERHVDILEADQHAAEVRVDMGTPEVTGLSTCDIDGQVFAGLGVDMGNPHLACVVPGLSAASLAEMELRAPAFDQDFFPHGVNVEIVTELEEDSVSMRVWERGVGETRSCGTGTVAAACAALADAGLGEGTVRVKVPGGEVEVQIFDDGSTLTGPSKIIALGEVEI
ncbi:diaminopimelate epimerase [Corynebacterium suranareeae]|uniref:Diaminopimelate epimerase n=1 Tax=Corynebacterium suranareeae TaxID=2506452 RepID=A0A160PRJ6_9CORY|nr:diaminopimelate epimerase [Corynebacterium suranareeae]BAU96276.1 diaminopimelate epimerase [Corynebacterium suranareeae]